MNILTFAAGVEFQFTRGAGTVHSSIPPYVPYVFARAQFGAVNHPNVQGKVFRTSILQPRLRAFNLKAAMQQATTGHNRVLLYNGCGGYGDQIMTWPIGQWLHKAGLAVYILADPGNDVAWHMFPWVKGLYTLPLQLETLHLFDHHAFFEIVTNVDDHPGQSHPVDTMLNQMGVDPESVEPKYKVVKPYFSAAELNEADNMFKGQDIAIYQLHCGSQTRHLLPAESAYLLKTLAERYQNLTWVAVYDSLFGEPYKNAAAKQLPKNVSLYRAPAIRQLWALAQRAKVVVAPDSMMVHIAGSLEIPCVGLWGPTHHELRTRYYKHHFPVQCYSACQWAPCHTYMPNFPQICPPMPTATITAQRTQCEAMTHITPDMVTQSVKEALTVNVG